jgi:hypothetical protein
MDDDRRVEPEAERVAPADDHGRILLVVTLVVTALLVGIVRPWDLLTGPGSVQPGANQAGGGPPVGEAGSLEPPGAGHATPAPTSDDPYAALWTTCGSPSGWRAATIQQWSGRAGPIRSWIAIDAVAATGPLDPVIPFAPVATDIVTAIGYCSPLADDLRPPETAGATLWMLAGSLAIPVTAALLEPAQPSALGGLWRPPTGVEETVHGFDAWPPGRYVIEIRSPSGPYDRWLGIEIEDLRARTTPSPTGIAAPAAPGSGSPAATGALP